MTLICMQYFVKRSILYALPLLMCLYVRAQEPGNLDWHLVKDKNAIKVYTAPAVSGSLKYIKVDALLDGTLKKFIAVFQNVPDQNKWVYGTERSYVIKKFSDHDLIYYNKTKLPWPISDRDAAIHMKIEEDNKQTVIITTTGEPTAIPINDKIVRITHFVGNWTAGDAGNGKIKVRYFIDIDPGGSIPAWIINMFITKGPYETLMGLARQLQP